MDAHGHEHIEGYVGKYLCKILKYGHPQEYNRLISYFKSEEQINDLLYMGNWLTDFSQFFSPDSFFNIRNGINDFIVHYNETIVTSLDSVASLFDFDNYVFKHIYIESVLEWDDSISRIQIGTTISLAEKNGYTNIQKSKIDKFVRIADKKLKNNDSNFTIEGIVNSIKQHFQQSKRDFESMLNKTVAVPAINAINQIKNDITISQKTLDDWFKVSVEEFQYNDTSNYMWQLANISVKALSYKHFCRKSDWLHMEVQNMNFENYKAVYENFINERKDGILNQYYPNVHLDRKPSLEKIKNVGLGIIKSSLAKKRDFVDTNLSEDNLRYKYLDDYIVVIAGKLTEISKEWVIDGLLKGKPISKQDYLMLLPKLGHTLHGVEDFFAHSNFVELCVYNLQNISSTYPSSSDYFSKEEFIDLFDDKEKQKYEETFRPYISPDNAKSEIEKELKVTTGIYAEGDMEVSMYHLGFGKFLNFAKKADYVDALLKDSEEQDPSSVPKAERKQRYNTSTIDALTYFIIGLQGLLNAYPNQFNEFIIRLGNPTKEVFITEDAFNFIVSQKFADSFNISIDSQEREHTLQIINDLIAVILGVQMAKKGANYLNELLSNTLALKELLLLTYLLLMLIVAPESAPMLIRMILAQIRKIIIKIVGEEVYKVIKALVNTLLKKVVVSLVNLLADSLEGKLGIHSETMSGTHSVIAKDEKYRKPNLHYQALRMATYMDATILNAMFFGNVKKENQTIDFQNFLDVFFASPMTNGGAVIHSTITHYMNPIEFRKQNELEMTLGELMQIGIANKIDTISSEQFLSGFYQCNFPYFNKKSNISKSLKEIIVERRDLSFFKNLAYKESKGIPILIVLLPFQKDNKLYGYTGNNLVIIKINDPLNFGSSKPDYKHWAYQFFNKHYYENPDEDKLLVDEIIENYEEKEEKENPMIKDQFDLNGIFNDTYQLNLNGFKHIKTNDMKFMIEKYRIKEKLLQKEYEEFLKEYLRLTKMDI